MLDRSAQLLNQEISKPKNIGATLRRFAPYFRPYWLQLIVVVFFMLLSTYTIVHAPKLIGQAVDCYLYPNPNCTREAPGAIFTADEAASRLGMIVLEILGLYALGAASIGIMFYTMNWVGQHALIRLRTDVFRHVHRLSLGYFSRSESGNVMSRFTSDADAIQQAFNFALVNVLRNSLVIVSVMITMMQTNLPYALLSLSIVPVMIFATVYFSNQARKAFRRSREEMGSVNADLQESIAGVREVQAFSREDENISNFQRVNAANRDANVRAASFTSALTPVLEALGYVAIAIVVVVGGISVIRNQPLLGTEIISLGTVLVFLQYTQQFNQPIQQVALLWTNVQNALAGGERIFNLLDEVPDIVDKPNASPMPPIQGRVSFKNVHAEYVAGDPVLRGVNLTTEPGEMIAVVGPTGAGKTTLVNLIPRFYDATYGSVQIDGIDVRDVDRHSLRQQIGIVLQDSFLFSDTVMNNIRYGRLDATDEEVISAAKLAHAHDFIERLPQGYQTLLGERGAGLSQGQRQLLSIARAALANPHLLILDEATSSVDTRTERLIQQALEELLSGRTSFVIAHRLSTIRSADQVLMVSDGEIIERGTHQTLLAQRGAYYDLYMSQFQQEESAEPATD